MPATCFDTLDLWSLHGVRKFISGRHTGPGADHAGGDHEAGCHAYCFAADPCDPVAIQVYELWQDSDSLVAHFEHENYHAMVELSSQVGFLESINRAYLTEKNESVYGPDFEKKTSFFQASV